MFSLRLQGGIPLSEQLEARIAELIIGGKMAENEKLPAVREVAKALTINPNTVQKTYRQLEQRGLIYFASGKGQLCCGAFTIFFCRVEKSSRGISSGCDRCEKIRAYRRDDD